MPWADALYACDFAWWEKYCGVPEFSGLKLSQDIKAIRRPWGVQKVALAKEDDRLQLLEYGKVGWGGNGGFHCLNLAVQMLPRRIVLVGFDMTVKHGLHWHGKHVSGLNNPTEQNVERWRRVTDAAAEKIEAMGIEVVNCSPISALQNYRKMDFREALQC